MADKYTYSEAANTPIIRAAFLRAFDPEERTNPTTGKPEKTWGLTAIAPKGTDITVIKKAIVEAATKMWGDKAAEKMKHPKFKDCLKDGGTQVDKEGKLYAGFEAGQITFKLATKAKQPAMVDRLCRDIIDAEGTTLVDKENGLHEQIEKNKAFSGCWFIARFSAMAYDREDGFGVSLKLEFLQLAKQDERLGGGGSSVAPAAVFGVLPEEDADLDDLMS